MHASRIYVYREIPMSGGAKMMRGDREIYARCALSRVSKHMYQFPKHDHQHVLSLRCTLRDIVYSLYRSLKPFKTSQSPTKSLLHYLMHLHAYYITTITMLIRNNLKRITATRHEKNVPHGHAMYAMLDCAFCSICCAAALRTRSYPYGEIKTKRHPTQKALYENNTRMGKQKQ